MRVLKSWLQVCPVVILVVFFFGLNVVAAPVSALESRPISIPPPDQPIPGPKPSDCFSSTPVWGVEVVHEYPHDKLAFTQGLVVRDKVFFESTGLWGRSSLREVDIATGNVMKIHRLQRRYFAEGLTRIEDKLYQLTWRSKLLFIYDLASLEPVESFQLEGIQEGWGLTFDGKRLIISDGTNRLHFKHPKTYQSLGSLEIFDNGHPLPNINELEYVQGAVFANIWRSHFIAVLDIEHGKVKKWVDLSNIVAMDSHPQKGVLNGIAYESESDRLFVTGKHWSKIFEIKLIPKADVVPTCEENG